MLIYIEYYSRRAGIALEAFHKVAGAGQSGWADEYESDDRLLLGLGRTWRIGPEPEYMAVWWTPGHGLDRLDDWEREFRSGAATSFEEPFRVVARIDRAGCYEPVLDPVPGATERYYVEWFDFDDVDAVRAHYEDRRARRPTLTLNLVAARIGLLAPEPRGLAVWGLGSWADLELIARDLDAGSAGPLRPVTASLYSTFGHETL